MARAKYPHDSKRPSPKAVKRALASGNIDALKKALTPRQRVFAEEYVIDFNATAAAIRAGYSLNSVDKQAYILTHHEGVSAYIDHLMTSRQAKIASADPDYVIQKAMSIINKEKVRDGDALRGLELLARILGMLRDKTEITGKDGGPLEIEQRTQEEVQSFTHLLKSLAEKSKKEVEITDVRPQ